MMENDDLNEIPPHENLINGDKRFNYCINEQTYQVINEKKNLLQLLKQQRDELLIDFNGKNRLIFTKHDLITSLMLKRININQLREYLVLSDLKIKQNQEEINTIKKRITKKKQALGSYLQKIDTCKEMLKKSENAAYNKTNNEKDGFNKLKLRLIEYEKQRIDELNKHIFDLVEIKPKDEDMLQKSTRTALKDARQTVYVNGRWILANDHVIYRIVRSTLPTDGDYMPYYKELQLKDEKLKDESQHLDYLNQANLNNRNNQFWSTISSTNVNSLSSSTLGSTVRSIDRRTILSGLTFTVQFVNLIAFYLNIVLPYNLPHNKFSNQTLTDDQFQNSVAKLNTNIVYLSINQHIPVTNLLPKHTLENLNHFLTYFREMRIKIREKHSISFPNHMIPLLDEMFTDTEEDHLIQDSMPNLIFNDNEDWETVPNSNEIPSDDTCNSNQSRNVSTSLISSVLSQFWFKNTPQSK